MIIILVRFMQIGRAREIGQIYARFMVNLPDLACTSNLQEPHQNKNHSLINLNFVICINMNKTHAADQILIIL